MIRLLHAVAGFIFLLTAAAYPEILTKGKHMRVQEALQTSAEDLDMPRFAEPIANVTVSIGRDALLACVVENLKGYKVAWVRVDTQTILSIHHNVISQNNRISLTYNDHRSWYLHIKEVEESDRGWYMCQVNTDPMRSRKGYLQVVVPPVILEAQTSNDMVVREGLNVTLMCKARGYPEPYVMWRREDGEEMLIGGEHVNVVDGEFLHITKVSRLHMAAYLCVASNGVPPSISKRVHLRVQFPPMLSIPNQLEGAYVGQDVILECHTEAYPASINYWTTERGDMIISDTSRAGDKYETTSTVNGYMKYMKLKIRSVGPNDFGTYRCVAKNSLGETDGNIKLDEMPAPTTAIISEMAMLNRSLGTMHSRKNGKRRNRNKFDLNSLPDYGLEEWRDGAGGNNMANSDNNQTPVRNPPGAFHNAAGTLAQHNLLGSIIQWIRMQSLGMLEHLVESLTVSEEAAAAMGTTNNRAIARIVQPSQPGMNVVNVGTLSSNNKNNYDDDDDDDNKNQNTGIKKNHGKCWQQQQQQQDDNNYNNANSNNNNNNNNKNSNNMQQVNKLKNMLQIISDIFTSILNNNNDNINITSRFSNNNIKENNNNISILSPHPPALQSKTLQLLLLSLLLLHRPPTLLLSLFLSFICIVIFRVAIVSSDIFFACCCCLVYACCSSDDGSHCCCCRPHRRGCRCGRRHSLWWQHFISQSSHNNNSSSHKYAFYIMANRLSDLAAVKTTPTTTTSQTTVTTTTSTFEVYRSTSR